MGKDRKGYTWVLLTKSTTNGEVSTHGVYSSYQDLMDEIDRIESFYSFMIFYDYEQFPIY